MRLSVNLQYPIQHKDILCIKDIKFPTLQQVADFLEKKLSDRIKVKFQHQEVELIRENSSVRLEDKVLSPNDEIPNGSSLVWDETNNNSWIFQDVFRFVDWTYPNNVSSFKILKNGNASGFDDEIFGGDELEIIFQ